MHGTKQRPADAHPGQWVLIAPGNPAGLRGGTGSAAAPISRSPLRPADWPWRCLPASRRGWAAARAGDGCLFPRAGAGLWAAVCSQPQPWCGKDVLRHSLYTRPYRVPPFSSPVTLFPSLHLCVLFLRVIRIFQRSACPWFANSVVSPGERSCRSEVLSPRSLMEPRRHLPAAGSPSCLRLLSPFLHFLNEMI